ncbi:ABC transporter permease subunit [Escherichia coli]|nr:ABC transporter permease subunit [Escherichia coli]
MKAPKLGLFFYRFFSPIYLSTLSALRGVEPKLKEVAKVLGFTRKETLQNLTLPAAMPGILTGLRLGFGYSWRALVGAELVAASSGLGFMISEAGEFVQTDIVFVGVLTIAILGVFADVLLKYIVSRFIVM